MFYFMMAVGILIVLFSSSLGGWLYVLIFVWLLIVATYEEDSPKPPDIKPSTRDDWERQEREYWLRKNPP